MRLTDFWERMERRFGRSYVDSYARDQALPALGSRTVTEALAAGEDAVVVWRAVVASTEGIDPRDR